MPARRLRSRSFRRLKVKLPGNRVTIHYRKRVPKAATCPVTGEKLHGVPRGTPGQLHKLPKAQRRPERPYGGVLSSKAMREEFRKEARGMELEKR